MLKTLQNRGPDESGMYIRKNVFFAHSRLSVIDPENGKQPMTARLGGAEITLVYNGELYNANELREELINAGHTLREHSDTEVLLHSYLRWGERCPERLNGIFAFAVWDERDGKVFLCRDRMGVKPLFYAPRGDTLVFGSEIKALLQIPIVRPEVDEEGLSELFFIGPGVTPGSAVFKGVNELPPAECAVFKKSGLKTWKYWRLEPAKHEENFSETLEHTRFLVEDAIKRQTVSDVPLCSFLSGGLDSSAITAISGVKKSFSVNYEDNEKYFASNKFQPDSDDAYIKQMTEFLGIEHENVILKIDDLTNALYAAVEARDLPGMADIDSSLLLFCRKVKETATVALSGECSDEIFGGYPWYRDDDILGRAQFPWSRTTKYRASFAKKGIFGRIDPYEFVKSRYDKTVADTKKTGGENAKDSRIKEMFRLNVDWFMQTLLTRKDRMSMACGLEVRVPFCDHRIAEYLYNAPWEYKNYKGREKGLLREALVGILPEGVLWRKKSPYPKTFHPDYLNAVSARLREIISDADAPVLQIADKTALLRLTSSEGETEPWYGQLMSAPQTMAYFIQMNHWLKKYGVILP